MRRRWKSCVVKEVIEGRRVVGAVARKNLCVAYRGGTALHCTALHCTALHCTAMQCNAMQCTPNTKMQ